MKVSEYLFYGRRLGFSLGWLAGLLALYLVTTVFESLAILQLLPVMQYLENHGNIEPLIESSELWRNLHEVTRYLDLSLTLELLLGVAFASIVFRQVFTYIRLLYGKAVLETYVRRLQDKVFKKYLSVNTAYHDRVSSGDIVNVIGVEIRLTGLGFNSVAELVGYVIQLVVYIIILMTLSWSLTITTLAVMVVTALCLRGLMKMSLQYGREVAAASKNLFTYLNERLHSPRLIRLSGTEKAEIDSENKLTMELAEIGIKTARVQARTEVMVEPIMAGIALVLILVSFRELELPLGVIGLFLFILLRLMPIAKAMVLVWQGVLGARGHFEMVDSRLTDMEEAVEPVGGDRHFAGFKDCIKYENLTYRYPNAEKDALTTVSFEIPARTMTGLVGHSGSGKSTLIDLLPRFREPQAGAIVIDGVSLEAFSIESLRRGIGFAPQMPHLFNTTVEQHIRYGKSDASDEEVREAARLAGADEFVSQLPDQYKTFLGESGIRLSGGQRQRLDLARVLVRKAPILVLDEPTSSLDPEAQQAFRDVINRIRKETDTTIIVIAHQLSSVVNADQTIVLKDGKVDAIGSHAELLESCEWYQKAFGFDANDFNQDAAAKEASGD